MGLMPAWDIGGPGGRSPRPAARAGEAPLAHRLRLVNQAPQSVAELAAGAVQPAADRAHGDLEDLADLLVTAAVEVLEDDDRAMLGAEPVQRRPDDPLALGPLQRGRRIRLGRLVGRMGPPRGRAAGAPAAARTGPAAADGPRAPGSPRSGRSTCRTSCLPGTDRASRTRGRTRPGGCPRRRRPSRSSGRSWG